MRLHMDLTAAEAQALFARTLAGIQRADEELASLEHCPASARDYVYGPGLLEATRGVRDDLVDLLSDTAAALDAAYLREGNHHGTETIL